MKKAVDIFLLIAILLSFPACSNVEFTEIENKVVVSNDGSEYIFVGFEGDVFSFGELNFIGNVSGEKSTFNHLGSTIKTGMYSVGGSKDILMRYFPNNEFAAIYIKSDLLKTEVALENCVRFEFIKRLGDNDEKNSNKSITECVEFLNAIKSGLTAQEAKLYDLVKQPDGTLKNCYVYGYICGVLQENLNLVIPLEVVSFDGKAFSIKIDNEEYALPEEWLDKLI